MHKYITSRQEEAMAQLAQMLNGCIGAHILVEHNLIRRALNLEEVASPQGSLVASTKEPEWLSTPQECDEYNPEQEKLKARRARLLDRIQESSGHLNWNPSDRLAQEVLNDLKDELAAVEAELGYPEPKEPEEA